MKASEAKAKSEAVARQIAAENAASAEKARLTLIENEKARRLKFIREFNEQVDHSILYNIKQGDKSTRVYVGEHKDKYAQARDAYDNHEYLDVIKKTLKRLTKDGYKVETGVNTSTHTTQHESSVPDYNYYTHSAYIDISWE